MVDAHGDVVDLSGNGRLTKSIKKRGAQGTSPPLGTIVKVHYVGTLEDGTQFDSSRERGTPFEFTVGEREVILGWDKGVASMNRGEVAVLRCAPEYAYGGSTIGKIPANSTLVFEVELLDWRKPGLVNNLNMLLPTILMVLGLLLMLYMGK